MREKKGVDVRGWERKIHGEGSQWEKKVEGGGRTYVVHNIKIDKEEEEGGKTQQKKLKGQEHKK